MLSVCQEGIDDPHELSRKLMQLSGAAPLKQTQKWIAYVKRNLETGNSKRLQGKEKKNKIETIEKKDVCISFTKHVGMDNAVTGQHSVLMCHYAY